MKVALVVSFLDEEARLPGLLDSLVTQELPPAQLVLVDDGSGDRSAEIAEAFAEVHAWARVVRRPPRRRDRDRLEGGTVLASLRHGLGFLEEGWDVVGKVDADMVLTPLTLSAVAGRLERDPHLGMCGPFIAEPDSDGRPARKPCGPGHVEGSTKFYRRECLEDIWPIPPILGWDVIDESTARARGWRTESFAVPGGDPLHTRPMGDHDGRLRACRRWGRCGYAYGAHPLHALAYGGRMMAVDRPYLAGGVNYLAGYAGAALRKVPRADTDVRRHVRAEQLGRMRQRLRSLRPSD